MLRISRLPEIVTFASGFHFGESTVEFCCVCLEHLDGTRESDAGRWQLIAIKM